MREKKTDEINKTDESNQHCRIKESKFINSGNFSVVICFPEIGIRV